MTRNSTNVLKYRRKQQAYIASLKDAPCTDCGGRFHSEAMQFDHLDSSKKFKMISLMYTYCRERIDEEVAKCELVCANCHAVRTYERRTRVVQW